mgnify:CR=1 FL=1
MIGQTVPDICLKSRVRDESVEGPNPFRWQDVQSEDLCGVFRAVVFRRPGAVTPNCSSR